MQRASEARKISQFNMSPWIWCRRKDFSYINHWVLVQGRSDLYKDGLDLNLRGADIFAGRCTRVTEVFNQEWQGSRSKSRLMER